MVGCYDELREFVDVNGVSPNLGTTFAIPDRQGANGWEVYKVTGLRWFNGNTYIRGLTLDRAGNPMYNQQGWDICTSRAFGRMCVIINEYNEWQFKK